MSTDTVRAALAGLVAATNPDGETSVADWRKAWDAARAALSEPVPSVVAPDGWQLVPKEPTPEMLRAVVKLKEGPAVYKVMSFAGLAVLEEDAKDEYAAALAAATPPAMPVETNTTAELVRNFVRAVERERLAERGCDDNGRRYK